MPLEFTIENYTNPYSCIYSIKLHDPYELIIIFYYPKGFKFEMEFFLTYNMERVKTYDHLLSFKKIVLYAINAKEISRNIKTVIRDVCNLFSFSYKIFL